VPGLDRHLRVVPRSASLARPGRLPGRDRFRRDPDREAPTPLQRLIVFRPVLDAVARLWDLMAARLIGLVGHQASSKRGSGPIRSPPPRPNSEAAILHQHPSGAFHDGPAAALRPAATPSPCRPVQRRLSCQRHCLCLHDPPTAARPSVSLLACLQPGARPLRGSEVPMPDVRCRPGWHNGCARLPARPLASRPGPRPQGGRNAARLAEQPHPSRGSSSPSAGLSSATACCCFQIR